MATVMKSREAANAALEIYNNLVTIYAKGGYGQYIDNATYNALCNQYAWNRTHFNQNYLGKYATDCICWIKGMLSGWRYNVKITSQMYCKKIPDFTDDEFGKMLTDCVPIADAKEGYGLWKQGHAGMCVGNGMAIDADYSVNGGKVVVNGMKLRKLSDVNWTKAGKIPYIDYSDQNSVKVGDLIPMIVAKIEGDKAYGEATVTPAPAPTPAVITVGSKVTIDKGAKAGGLNKNYRGKLIDPKYANGKYVDTVTKIETHYGVEEALLKNIVTWVALTSLKLAE